VPEAEPPAELLDVVGQPRAVRDLERKLAAGRLPHALLFVGPPGVGKATTAWAIANRLLGAGDGAEKLASRNHPDYLVLSPQGAGNVINVEAVRELGAKLAFAPHEGAVRIVVLEDADRLTIEASNAFLKTLEEPPPRNHFILISSAPERLLITIRSRCQVVRFVPLATAAIATILARRGVEAARAKQAAALAGGSASRAAELVEGEALGKRSEALGKLRAAAKAGDYATISQTATELAGAKEDLPAVLELAAVWYRDAAALAAGAPHELLVHAESERAALEAEAHGVSPAELARKAGCVLEAQLALTGYAHAGLTLENMLLGIRGVRA
jgi:DNA polymerase III subunit delta'